METPKSGRRSSVFFGCAAVTALACLGVCGWWAALIAQSADAAGTISGSVTADQGEVRAFRVRATDTLHKIIYTVFTNKGRYQMFNLPPSTYEVQVSEENFDSPVLTVVVRPRGAEVANVAVKAEAPKHSLEIVDFNTLYTPSPARDLIVKYCLGCHGLAGEPRGGQRAWHLFGGRTEAGWRRGVELMFHGNYYSQLPLIAPGTITRAEKESIIKYLAASFGPKSKARDLPRDPLVRDEDALARAIYIQYELPPGKSAHDVFPSPTSDGRTVIYMAGSKTDSILALDPRNLDYATRTTEWNIPKGDEAAVSPVGMIMSKGHLYWTELRGGHVGELNPQTGEIHRYPAPTPGGGGHSLRADLKGNVWYSNYAGIGLIGKLDAKTRKVTELETPVKGSAGYGITVDYQDRVWASAPSTRAVFMYDQSTGKWKSYPTTDPTRRLTVDSKGRIWACEYYGNRVAMIDPATDKVTEYDLPLKYGNLYELAADPKDRLWADNANYGSLVGFDQQSGKFTYFPYPRSAGHTPKIEFDSEGTLWFFFTFESLYRMPTTEELHTKTERSMLTAFKPTGNAPASKQTAGLLQ